MGEVSEIEAAIARVLELDAATVLPVESSRVQDAALELWELAPALARELDQERRHSKRLGEMLSAARSGQPLGPLVGACTIADQEVELKTLRVKACELEAAKSAVELMRRERDALRHSAHPEIARQLLEKQGQLNDALARVEELQFKLDHILECEETNGLLDAFLCELEQKKKALARVEELEAKVADAVACFEIECSCCGQIAASWAVSDGDGLECGCDGQISCDSETCPYADADGCGCGGSGYPKPAECKEGV